MWGHQREYSTMGSRIGTTYADYRHPASREARSKRPRSISHGAYRAGLLLDGQSAIEHEHERLDVTSPTMPQLQARRSSARQETPPSAGINGSSSTNVPTPLRRGKWTRSEERYAQKMIAYFREGLLDLPLGTTLRFYLSDELSCDPMRVTKKFAGDKSIGKRLFHPVEKSPENTRLIEEAHAELRDLRQNWLAEVNGASSSKRRRVRRAANAAKAAATATTVWLSQGDAHSPRSIGEGLVGYQEQHSSSGHKSQDDEDTNFATSSSEGSNSVGIQHHRMDQLLMTCGEQRDKKRETQGSKPLSGYSSLEMEACGSLVGMSEQHF